MADLPEKHMCGRRAEVPAAFKVSESDTWETRPNGDRTCSFCGSLSEPDFIDILEKYADGEPGYHFDRTTKSYKFYAHRPGVRNAGDGGIKFYTMHIDTTPGPDVDRREVIYLRAIRRHQAEMQERFGGKLA